MNAKDIKFSQRVGHPQGKSHKRIVSILIATLILICAIAMPSILSRGGSVRPVEPMHAYPDFPADAVPRLVSCRQLSALSGFQSPKPVVSADQNGNVVVLAHGFVNSPLGSDILLWRSSDRGVTWDLPRNLTNLAKSGKIEFDPWLESDRRESYYSVYASRADGSIVFCSSHDGGKVWAEGRRLLWRHADRPVLGISPDGMRLVIAASMAELAADASTDVLDPKAADFAQKLRERYRVSAGIFVSEDQGNHWKRTPSPFGDNRQAIPFAATIDSTGLIAATWILEGEGSSSAVSVSSDGGNTWHETLLVQSLQKDRNHPFNGERFPVIAGNSVSGLHVACVNPEMRSLQYHNSKDGRNWSRPVSLSSRSAEEIRMAAIDAIGPFAHVMWMERVGVTWHVWLRSSRDFGKTWSEPLCLSASIQFSDDTTASGFAIYGDDDQSSLRDDGQGRIHAVWCITGGRVLHCIVEMGDAR
ncbi:MAG: hypothetical protein JNL58_14970 [Planctomyces sp.]|nr:hypothetical protein [Planctomyces sp.]